MYCAIEGHLEGVNSLAEMMRISSYRIHQSLVEKPLSIEKYWPLPSDKESTEEGLIMTPDLLEKIKEIHGL